MGPSLAIRKMLRRWTLSLGSGGESRDEKFGRTLLYPYFHGWLGGWLGGWVGGVEELTLKLTSASTRVGVEVWLSLAK